jgi:hypothetical protein
MGPEKQQKTGYGASGWPAHYYFSGTFFVLTRMRVVSVEL